MKKIFCATLLVALSAGASASDYKSIASDYWNSLIDHATVFFGGSTEPGFKGVTGNGGRPGGDGGSDTGGQGGSAGGNTNGVTGNGG